MPEETYKRPKDANVRNATYISYTDDRNNGGNVYAIKCPNCEANIQINVGEKRVLFCQYCGTQLFFDDGIRRSEHKTVIIDEAEIKKSEDDRIVRMQALKNQEKFEKNSNRSLILMFAFFGFLILLYFLYDGITDISSCVKENKSEKLRVEMELQGKINAGTYYDYIGKNYKAVINDLTEKGFTNIETLDLNDAGGLIFM